MPESFVTRADERNQLKVAGEGIAVLAPGSRTQGYEVFHQAGPEGSGPPPHSHGWDESFYVVRGEVAYGLGAEAPAVANAGDFVHVPAGVTHWFRYGPGGGEMVSMTSRQGASALFTDLDRHVPPGPPKAEDLPVLAEVALRNGLKFEIPGA